MQIAYPPFINASGEYKDVSVDPISGDVTLKVLVKGKPATITMPIAEAKRLFDDMTLNDISGVAKDYA